MVRKILHIGLALVLLVTTTGITYHYHYCCNTLIRFSILHTPKPCCEHPETCCHDEAVTLQMKTDFVFAADLPDLSVISLEIPIVQADDVLIPYTDVQVTVLPEESPPPDIGLRLSRMQQYLI
jgi:hypothetical protein